MFDARTAKLLAPGEHLTIGAAPGLRLEATQKYRTWTYRYKSPVDGRMRQVKLGQWPAMNFAAAMGAWEKARQVRDAGQDPAQIKRSLRAASVAAAKVAAANQQMTLGRVATDYHQKLVKHQRSKKSADEVERMFSKMLGDDANQPAATYTRAQAYALLERWAHAPVQAAVLRRELAAAWDRALDADDLPEDTPNWWRMVMRGKLKSRGKKIGGVHQGTAKRVLSEAEVALLLAWLPNFSRLVSDALTLYLWTACRGSEIMAMEAREISDEPSGLWWTIPKAKTKNARREGAGDLRVPLIGRAQAIVRRRLALLPEGGYLFASTDKCGHTQQKTISVAVHFHQPYSKTRPQLLRPRLPVTHWAPHDLRRTVRTMLTALGCPDDVAEAVVGHMQPGVRGIYNLHQYDQERRDWLAAIDRRLESLAS